MFFISPLFRIEYDVWASHDLVINHHTEGLLRSNQRIDNLPLIVLSLIQGLVLVSEIIAVHQWILHGHTFQLLLLVQERIEDNFGAF